MDDINACDFVRRPRPPVSTTHTPTPKIRFTVLLERTPVAAHRPFNTIFLHPTEDYWREVSNVRGREYCHEFIHARTLAAGGDSVMALSTQGVVLGPCRTLQLSDPQPKEHDDEDQGVDRQSGQYDREDRVYNTKNTKGRT